MAKVSVTQQAGCFEPRGGILDQLVVGRLHIARVRRPAMTGDAAQPPVHGIDRRGLDEQTLALTLGDGRRLDLLSIGVAADAFGREGSGVVQTGQGGRGIRMFSKRLNGRLKHQT
jgi:hypothetical protein